MGKTLSITAGVFFLVSMALPLWEVAMKAPTYPERALSIRVYSYKVEGDIDEWNRVGKLVGVKVPPPVPDIAYTFIPVVILALALFAFVSAFKRNVAPFVVILSCFFIFFLSAWAQYSLYLFGHNLDPNRPLKYFNEFTPPIIGIIRLGNIRTYHFPHMGSFFYAFATLMMMRLFWTQKKEKKA